MPNDLEDATRYMLTRIFTMEELFKLFSSKKTINKPGDVIEQPITRFNSLGYAQVAGTPKELLK